MCAVWRAVKSTQQSKQRPGTRLRPTIPEILDGEEIQFRLSIFFPVSERLCLENSLENDESNIFLPRSPSWPEAQCWWGSAAEWRRPSRQCSMQVQMVCRCVHWLLSDNEIFSFVISGYAVMRWVAVHPPNKQRRHYCIFTTAKGLPEV